MTSSNTRWVLGRALVLLNGLKYLRPCQTSFSFGFRQLKYSNDSFSVVADYFGRGVFNKLTLITDLPLSKSAAALDASLQRDLLVKTKRGT